MKKKSIDLALQGGGTHGAFTWGILDKFLECGCFTIEGISATSAGSMNAVVLAHGMISGGNEGARHALHQFWKRVGEYGYYFGLTDPALFDSLLPPMFSTSLQFTFYSYIASILSPYQFNPLNIHLIRDVLDDFIDFENIKKNSTIKLFIGATNVTTGKIRIFNHEELSLDVILASACLPKLFQAVKVGDDYYWDGGYLGNPALFPLIYTTSCTDIVILHTVPIIRETLPTTVLEIETRLREVSFNSSLMREMRAISFVTQLIEEGWVKKKYENKLKKVHIHCIRADKVLDKLALASVYTPNWEFLLHLRDLGRDAADIWLSAHYASIGKKTTIDFNEWL